MKKLSFLDKIIYIINSLLATVLLLSYLLPFVSPKTIPIFAVLSLFVPILIIINIIFIIYWLIKLKKQFFLSAVVLAIGWTFSSPFYKISDKNNSLNDDLIMMSYNVKSFDLFHNKKETTLHTNGFSFITDKNPDVLAVQEFYHSNKIKLTFPYKYIKTRNNKSKFGMAIFSKFKIVNSGSLDFKDTPNNIIFADIVRKKDTIRIYNVHLESLRIKPNEENFGQKNSEKLLKRIANSFQKQATQTEQFLIHQQQWKGKKIVCGDFNNTSYSWIYKQFSNDKKDAFIEAGKGFGKSFNYIFPVRIDFILTDKSALINRFKTFSVNYSDHFPIEARINW